MKRSEINASIQKMEQLIQRQGVQLPPFCKWTPMEWASKGPEYNEIRDNMLGWDITDYGQGDFQHIGFALITLRNGKLNSDIYPKPYAEKLLMLQEDQYSPMHFHWYKMEDIINRGGGTALIRVYNATDDDGFANTDVRILKDGRAFYVPAGTQVRLEPGESITIYPRLYHDFSVEQGSGDILLGEVSMCNDDLTDNRFNPPMGRFPAVEEDEPPYRLLCTEYPVGDSSYLDCEITS